MLTRVRSLSQYMALIFRFAALKDDGLMVDLLETSGKNKFCCSEASNTSNSVEKWSVCRGLN